MQTYLQNWFLCLSCLWFISKLGLTWLWLDSSCCCWVRSSSTNFIAASTCSRTSCIRIWANMWAIRQYTFMETQRLRPMLRNAPATESTVKSFYFDFFTLINCFGDSSINLKTLCILRSTEKCWPKTEPPSMPPFRSLCAWAWWFRTRWVWAVDVTSIITTGLRLIWFTVQECLYWIFLS